MRAGRRARWQGPSVSRWRDRAVTPRGSFADPWLGDGSARAGISDIVRGLQLYRLACLIEGGLLLGAWLAAHATLLV